MFRVQQQQVTPLPDGNKEKLIPRSVLQILNPVITLMRVCGVCMGPCVAVENIGCSDYRFKLLHKDGWIHTLYCILVNSYLWIYSGILAYDLALLVPMSCEWIIAFQILAVNVSAAGCCTWASLNYRDGIYQSWMKDFYLYEQRHGVHENITEMLKKSRVFVAFVMTTGVLMPGFMLTYAFFTPEIRKIVFVVDRGLGWWNYLITAINCIILYIYLACSITSSVIGSYPPCSELDVINTIMKRCVEECMKRQESKTFHSKSAAECDYERNEQLWDIIGRHKHICSLISGYGNSISYFQFTAFFMSLPMSCFSLYVILTRMESQSNVSLCASILVLCSVSCIVLSITGVRVNVKAHTALQYVLMIPTEDLSEITLRAVNQLTSLLTGTSIGHNVYGLFTINPPTLLKIVGTLVTYVVVVLQFRQPASQTHLDTLCQDLVKNITHQLDHLP